MPISGSLGSGIAALKSYSKGLEVLGSNIANSSTVGYKGMRVEYGESFNNILQRSAAGSGASSTASQIGTGIGIQTTQGIFTQGNINDTGVPSDLAISGSGFFKVRDPIDDTQYITRAGNLRIDSSGFLVTQGGLRIQGLAGGTAEFIVTGSRLGEGQRALGIPSDPANIDAANGDTILNNIVVDPAGAGAGYDPENPPEVLIRGDGYGAKATATVNPDGTIAGVVIDNGGQGYSTFTISFADPPGSDLQYTLSGSTPPVEFGDVKIELPPIGNQPGNIQLNNKTINQNDPANNPLDPEDLNDQFPGIASYAINSNGQIQLLLDTGDFFTVGQVLMTDVKDPQALVREGDNLYSGFNVGGILVENGIPGEEGLGKIKQNALELSNVDLTEQFAELISTQRAFQAGSRIITTADTILQEVINLKR